MELPDNSLFPPLSRACQGPSGHPARVRVRARAATAEGALRRYCWPFHSQEAPSSLVWGIGQVVMLITGEVVSGV